MVQHFLISEFSERSDRFIISAQLPRLGDSLKSRITAASSGSRILFPGQFLETLLQT